MGDIAIKFENISKLYRIGSISTQTLYGDLSRWWAKSIGKEDPYEKIGISNTLNSQKGEYIWALKNINFEVKQGEILGIIGKNGAGKSTLLKILSKVTAPTSGLIKIKGRIASLLEVGTGFHPELTGRENIFLNGAILGMNKHEIQRKFDEIVDFSGVEKYINTPVKRYSSGMYVRLAFAVAAHLEPEILIIDEVLAVGDIEFQKKALGKMQNVSKGQGRTVFFVSHNMGAIRTLCPNSILLKDGTLKLSDLSEKVILEYLNLNNNPRSEWINLVQNNNLLHFEKIRISSIKGFQPNLLLEMELSIKGNSQSSNTFFAFELSDNEETTIFQTIPTFTLQQGYHNSDYLFTMKLPPLIPGVYFISAWVGPHNTETYDYQTKIIFFEILESPIPNRTFPYGKTHGYMMLESNIYKI